jgi:catechol-2,3-dioxygenase
MRFTRMGHSALNVKDLERALDFYTKVLGLEKFWVGDEDWANLRVGNDDLSLVLEGHSRHPPHVGFRVESADALRGMHAKLVAAGANPEAIEGHRDGSQSFYFTDPEGNVLEALWDPRLPA